MTPIRRRRSFAVAAFISGYLVALGGTFSPSFAQKAPTQPTPEIWFGPLQDRYDDKRKVISWTDTDFLDLVHSGALWARARRSVSALMLSVVHASEGYSQRGVPSLPEIGAMLSANHLAVGGGGSVVFTDGLCKGGGVEGMTDDKGFAREVYYTTKTWHDDGMPMEYFVIDGPYYFGYVFLQDKCHFTIEDVARRTATTLRMIRDLYPNIKLIDAEGPAAQPVANWLPNYHRFLDAFRREYGASIDYLDMDLHWTDTWHTGYRWTTAAKQIAEDMHKQGVKVSLIIDAEDQNWDPDVPPPNLKADPRTTMTADYWMAAVRKHIDLVKQDSIPLDAVDIESWMKFPRYNLPETDPLAWTSIINYAHDVLTPGK
jgi:hypothetical protein